MSPFETILAACAVTFVAIRVLEFAHWSIFASAGFRIRNSVEAALVEVENARSAERAHRAENRALTAIAEDVEAKRDREVRWRQAERARKTETPDPPQDC